MNKPIPAKGMPACPEWLMPEAKKEWERLAKLMNQMGVLTEAVQTFGLGILNLVFITVMLYLFLCVMTV